MDRQLTTAGLFAKWLLVPLALCGIGYFLIGPRIGGDPSKILPVSHATRPPADPVPSDAATDSSTPVPPKRAVRMGRGPEVEVSVARASDQPTNSALDSAPPRPRHHRRHHRSVEGTGAVRQSDTGGTTGATTGGGDTGATTGGTDTGTTGATTGGTDAGTTGATGGTDTGSTTGGR